MMRVGRTAVLFFLFFLPASSLFAVKSRVEIGNVGNSHRESLLWASVYEVIHRKIGDPQAKSKKSQITFTSKFQKLSSLVSSRFAKKPTCR